MKLFYYTHNKKDKNSGCHNAIGYDDGPFYTIHYSKKQKDKAKVEFKPAFDGYINGMTKTPMTDRFLLGKFNEHLFSKKEDSNEESN